MRYAKIRRFDVANGPDIRTTLFVTGCTNQCEGCFNSDLKEFTAGELWTKDTEEQFLSYVKSPNVKGVNILGGEPMDQIMDDCLVNLLRRIKKETGKSIWLWSGHLFEEILENPKRRAILKEVDVLVDGKFILAERDIKLQYRGSANQRVIDVKTTLETGEIKLLIEEPALV